MSVAVPQRDPVETARTLDRWLSGRLGVTTVEVSDLSIPKAGFSNETIVGHATWTDGSADHSADFVLRIEPTAHQLFVQPDALRQAQAMSALVGHVPVPRIWLTEADPAVLGAPFFMMHRVFGRIPGDVPSWHRKGWTAELDEAGQSRLHDNALAALAQLHAVGAGNAEIGFLESAGDGTALQRYVGHLHEWYEWCEPVRRYDTDLIDTAMAFVVDNVPAFAERSVVWGDARVGNIIFAEDLTVAALLDWEGATLGPREIDVTWWAMFDEFLCEAQGLRRLAGVPDRVGTLARYEEIAGVVLREPDYFAVLAGLQLALINSRLADLLISTGMLPETVAAEFVTRVTGITRRSLDRLIGY